MNKIVDMKHEHKHVYLEFTSLVDIVSYINRTEFCSCHKSNPRSLVNGDYNFFGTNSFEESMDLLLHGWEHGTREIKKELDAKHVNMVSKTKNVYDVHGYQCSVPMYLNNVPTNMIRKQNVMRKDKIINIYKDATYSGTTDRRLITRESVKVLQLVNRLENQGYRVNLYVYYASVDTPNRSNTNAKTLFINVPIKKSSQRLNIKQVAYPLCHPSMFRRTIFNVYEKQEEFNTEMLARTHGFVQMDRKIIASVLGKYIKTKSYVIPAINEERELLDIEKFAIN